MPSSEYRHPHIIPPGSSWRRQGQANGNATDSDGYVTERSSQQPPSSRRARKANRALPATQSMQDVPTESSPKIYPRRSNSSSSSSSSSSAPSTPDILPSLPSTGMGRKVAATLQLFKETVPVDDVKPGESLPRTESSLGDKADNVTEAQFEFVKRSEWPDREGRKEKSSTTLERRLTVSSSREDEQWPVKERKSSIRDTAIDDLAQWRKDVITRQDTGRGRRRERVTDEMVGDMNTRSDLSSEILNNTFRQPISHTSRTYPPSPSPSRSPANRAPAYSYHKRTPESTSRGGHSRAIVPDQSTAASHSRSPTPIRTQPSLPLLVSRPPSPQESGYFSPWSTDDESTWETASATTSASTTSAYTPFPSSISNPDTTPFADMEDADHIPLLLARDSNGHVGARFENPDKGHRLDLEDSETDVTSDYLPHIPLRPFRNQVGGHSAIYKFTKQAVCKVRRPHIVYSVSGLF